MKGVSYDKINNHYVAHMTLNGERNYLGSFQNYDDACVARKKFEDENKHKKKPRKPNKPRPYKINESKWLTFTCEAVGCDNERTQRKSSYNQAKKHYCSDKCRRDGLRGSIRVDKKVKQPKPIKKTKKELISEGIRNYFKQKEK